MSFTGQTATYDSGVLCQLPPAADIGPRERLITILRLLPKSRRYPSPDGNDYPCQQPNQGDYASIDGKDEPALRIEKLIHLALKMR